MDKLASEKLSLQKVGERGLEAVHPETLYGHALLVGLQGTEPLGGFEPMGAWYRSITECDAHH